MLQHWEHELFHCPWMCVAHDGRVKSLRYVKFATGDAQRASESLALSVPGFLKVPDAEFQAERYDFLRTGHDSIALEVLVNRTTPLSFSVPRKLLRSLDDSINPCINRHGCVSSVSFTLAMK